jgi:hypothetical protein
VIPQIIVTDGANFPIRQILTQGTGVDAPLGLHNGICEGLGLLHGQSKHMERQPLGGLTANAGEPCKLIRQLL